MKPYAHVLSWSSSHLVFNPWRTCMVGLHYLICLLICLSVFLSHNNRSQRQWPSKDWRRYHNVVLGSLSRFIRLPTKVHYDWFLGKLGKKCAFHRPLYILSVDYYSWTLDICCPRVLDIQPNNNWSAIQRAKEIRSGYNHAFWGCAFLAYQLAVFTSFAIASKFNANN